MPEKATTDTTHAAHPVRALGNDPIRVWLSGSAIGLLLALALPGALGWAVRAIAGWDAALVVLLGLPWRMILGSDPRAIRKRAAREDPGAVGTLAVSLVASIIGLGAVVFLLQRPDRFAAGRENLLVALGVGAVVGAWSLIHTAFSLHYAHLYYVDDGAPGGLEFAGGAPDDLDFAYFSFGIGMTYQVSEVGVSDRGIRRVVLGHSLLSFVFNTAILALAINLILGRL